MRWSNDGSQLIYQWSPYQVGFKTSVGADIYLYTRSSGKTTRLTSPEMFRTVDRDIPKVLEQLAEEQKVLESRKGLTDKDTIRVQTLSGVIAPRLTPDGRVTVDMGRPQFDPAQVPFDASGLSPVEQGSGQKWPLALDGKVLVATVLIALVSMGNPHAVQLVDNVDTAPVAEAGPLIERHARFPQRVNAGFLQIVDRTHVRLRVFERGAGETLACGTGACAAVSAGIRLGLLDNEVHVDTRGGRLTIAWSGADTDSVFMTGPATTVFEGQIDIPDTLL